MFDRRVRQLYGALHSDLCPNCFSSTTTGIVHDAEPPPGLPFVFQHRCSHCRLEIYSIPGAGLLEHPAVISFYDRPDRNLFGIPHWELTWLFDGRRITILEKDTLTFSIDSSAGENLTLDSLGTPTDSEILEITEDSPDIS